MNIKSALGFPTPKTICLRPCWESLQRVQSPMSSRITRNAWTGSEMQDSGLGVIETICSAGAAAAADLGLRMDSLSSCSIPGVSDSATDDSSTTVDDELP